jgi:hypothetical protein
MKGGADRYDELCQQIREARSQDRHPEALLLTLEALRWLPAMVRWTVKEFGRWDIPGVYVIPLACDYLAALQRRDELERVRTLLRSIPELAEWQETVDYGFERADLMGRVEKLLRENPGTLQKNMGRELGVDGRDVSNLLHYAQLIGVIRREPEGKSYRLYFEESPLATRNLQALSHPAADSAPQSTIEKRPSGCAMALLAAIAGALRNTLTR